jgi:hypothetical protein
LHPKKTQKNAKNLHNYPNSNKLQQTPYKTLQKSTKIKGREIPELPPYEPEKAFEFPLKFPYKINTFQRLAINNPHQRFQRTEKVGKKSPLDQLLHPLEFFSRFFGKR